MTGTDSVERVVVDVVRTVAGVVVPVDGVFFEAGLTSAALPAVHDELQRRFATAFALTVFFRHPTPRALAAFLSGPDSHPDAAAPTGPRSHTGGIASARRALRDRLNKRTG